MIATPQTSGPRSAPAQRSGPLVGERDQSRLGWSDLPFVAGALVAGALLLYLGRSATFWDDEWRSITFEGGGLDYLRPVNQHWWTVPLLLYRGTFAVVGLDSYIPYLAQVIVLHMVAAIGAYALVRRRLGPLPAALVSTPLVLLGAGAENIFWAFQTGMVASVMFGLWAVFFLERPGRRAVVVASLMLVAGLACSGLGPFFLVVAAGRTLLEPLLRRRVLAVAPPLALYLAWFLALGQGTVDEGRRLFIEAGVVGFVVRGIAFSTQQTFGFGFLADGEIIGLLVFLALAALTGVRTARGRGHGLAAGCLLGIAAMYTVVGLARLRDDPGYDHAVAGRFVYPAAFLLALAVVDLAPRRGEWSARGRRIGLATAAVLLIALGTSIAGNVDALRDERARFEFEATRTRAFVAVALDRGSEPWVDRTSPRDWMPSVAELERVIERHGSPVHDRWFPSVAEPPDRTALEEALLALAGEGFRVEAPSADGSLALTEIRAGEGAVTKESRCVAAGVTPQTPLWLLGVPSRARVRVTVSRDLKARIFLAHPGGPARRIFADFELGVARDIVVPDVGDARPWDVLVDSPGGPAPITTCVLLPMGSATGSVTASVTAW